jgi:hypothetical protein
MTAPACCQRWRPVRRARVLPHRSRYEDAGRRRVAPVPQVSAPRRTSRRLRIPCGRRCGLIGHGNDGKIGMRGLEAPGDLRASQIRKLEIEQDGIVFPGADGPEGFPSSRRGIRPQLAFDTRLAREPLSAGKLTQQRTLREEIGGIPRHGGLELQFTAAASCRSFSCQVWMSDSRLPRQMSHPHSSRRTTAARSASPGRHATKWKRRIS